MDRVSGSIWLCLLAAACLGAVGDRAGRGLDAEVDASALTAGTPSLLPDRDVTVGACRTSPSDLMCALDVDGEPWQLQLSRDEAR